MTTHPIPDAALEADIAILGKKGRGKSYTARGIVERLLAMGRRVVVLDPLSTWWGLAAGDQAFPIAVLGGAHGDLPLNEADGESLGRYLATAEISAVLDLGHMRKGELVRFATAFLEELYTGNRDPLWLVLEEADVFAPQNPGADTARLYGEVDRIARRGRAFGFRLITLTQRPARLAKDVLTQLSTLIALGITSPQDREAIKAWVEGNADRDRAREVVDTLAALKVGEGWVWAPDHDILERVTFPKNRTPDTSATPKAGERRSEAKVAGTVDVAALRAALSGGDTKIVAPAKASRKALRTEDITAEVEAAEKRGYARGLEAGAERAAREVRKLLEYFDTTQDLAARVRANLQGGAPALKGVIEAAPVEKAAESRASRNDVDLNSAARKMLAVLDTNPPVRRSWRQVATLAGLKARGGHFNAGKKALADHGLVVEDDGLVSIAAPSEGAKPEAVDRLALAEKWAGALTGAAPRILLHLVVVGADTREHIAKELGLQPRGGHWNAAWKKLRDNDLIAERDGRVRLSDIFPERRS